MEWYKKVLRQYADFEGRARRKEYWMFYLFNVLILIVPYALLLVGIVNRVDALTYVAGGVLLVYGLAVMVPSIAVTTRRLHDTGRSGWWQLLYLTGIIPFVGFVGGIVVFVFTVLDGNPGPNQYGPDPKAAERGFAEPGYPQGYPSAAGYPDHGHPQGYPPAPGYPQPGYPQPGYPQPGHPQPGHPQPGGAQPPYGT